MEKQQSKKNNHVLFPILATISAAHLDNLKQKLNANLSEDILISGSVRSEGEIETFRSFRSGK